MITKDLLTEIHRGWLNNTEQLLAKYRVVAERLKDTPVPQDFKDEARSKKSVQDRGEEQTRAREKEHYIYYVVAKENPELLHKFVMYEGIETTFAATRFVNRTADADFEQADVLSTNLMQEVREENPNAAIVKEQKDELVSKMSLIYNTNTYLINAGLQKDSLREFREYQTNLGKEVARRVMGENV